MSVALPGQRWADVASEPDADNDGEAGIESEQCTLPASAGCNEDAPPRDDVLRHANQSSSLAGDVNGRRFEGVGGGGGVSDDGEPFGDDSALPAIPADIHSWPRERMLAWMEEDVARISRG